MFEDALDVLGAETFTPTRAPSLFLGPTFDWYHIKQKDKPERMAGKSEVSHSSVVAGGVVYPQALIRHEPRHGGYVECGTR
jgi:hypothetical protein